MSRMSQMSQAVDLNQRNAQDAGPDRATALADIFSMLAHGSDRLNAEYVYELRREAAKLDELRVRYRQLLEQNRSLESRASSLEMELSVYRLGSRLGMVPC
jgi:hypothetical protein